MNILGFIRDLPVTLIISSLTLAAAAAPVQAAAVELTPDNFKTTTAKGLWFIEHFSPWCGHCKNFKPTWEKLVAEAATEIPQVKTGTINCVDYGDLCNENGIAGYPTMIMFEDGQKLADFKGSREMDRLKTFMKSFVKETPAPAAPKAESKPQKPAGPVLNPTGDVLALTEDNFDSILKKGPAFIKFYAPWCGHCKKLAPVWKQLARHMQGKLTIAEVNCDENSKLCAKSGIEGYPTLFYINGDSKKSKTEYNGGRKLDQLKAFAEKASTAGVQALEKDDDLVTHLEKEGVVYVLLHDSDNQDIINNVQEAAAPLLGSPIIYSSTSPELFKRFRLFKSTPWALVALKDGDVKVPASIFKGTKSFQESSNKLNRWLLTHRLPASLELTQDTFQDVMKAPQAPLVVIAAAPKDDSLRKKIAERITELGKKWRVRTDGTGEMNGREVVFTFMDAHKWSEWMKSMYSVKYEDKDDGEKYGLEDVRVIIADHSRLVYYDADHAGTPIKFTSTNNVFAAVDDAVNKKSAYKHSESFVERIARYLNNKMTAIEMFVSNKPWHAVGIFVVFIAAVFYAITRLASGPQDPEHMFRDYKGKNGRLD
ncbi:hypothetical protein CVT24_010499 [Panaeolus cyanescens]|uniref:Thioredoxin domain-containing protein n=1 Tax=Panaeolus cyanescens TaxID=181874 RepID=A0A409YLT8_9AGAR|nr:hypothetical protein CVT24_010499 [Panaeolus cyanescens]